MADKKITDLNELAEGAADADLLAIVDVTDTAGSAQGTSKKITVSNLQNSCLLKTNNLSDVASVETARSNLGVDAAGTDNSTDVTLTTVANNYLSIDGQAITVGTVPVALGGTGATDAATARSNLGAAGAINDLSDVDLTTTEPIANTSFLKYDGANWVPGAAEADVDGPLTVALRGTDNPHIGAHPNQSFKVVDNPNRSVMTVVDNDGNLTFLVSSEEASIKIQRPTGPALSASFGFSVVEDSTEPDIEVEATLGGASEKYSVISGDSDSKGVNGLPIRQGFNRLDIGANPAPILISGGSIA